MRLNKFLSIIYAKEQNKLQAEFEKMEYLKKLEEDAKQKLTVFMEQVAIEYSGNDAGLLEDFRNLESKVKSEDKMERVIFAIFHKLKTNFEKINKDLEQFRRQMAHHFSLDLDDFVNKTLNPQIGNIIFASKFNKLLGFLSNDGNILFKSLYDVVEVVNNEEMKHGSFQLVKFDYLDLLKSEKKKKFMII